jgi:transketolase
MENHSVIGGIGSAVAEVMAEHGAGIPLKRIGIKDTYAHGASQKYLLEELGLNAQSLVAAIEELTGQNLNIAAEDLAAVRVADVHSAAKAEAL